MSKVPSDVHGHILPNQVKIRMPELGPIFYLDTWPFSPPLLVVVGPDEAHQITEEQSLPKFHTLSEYMRPITGGNDLVSMEGDQWKKWRSLFNPGFASGHLTTLVPIMVEEMLFFCEKLRDHAKKSDIFPLDPHTARLSLDIIGRVAL